MTKSYYVRIRGRVQGPFDVDKMRALVRRGQVSRTHEVSEDGANWGPAVKYAELFETPKPAGNAPGAQSAQQKHDKEHTEDDLKLTGEQPGSTNDTWYYAVGSAQHGPVTHSALQHLFRIGTLSSDAEVWAPGMAAWDRASNVPGLTPATTQCPLTTPATPAKVAAGEMYSAARVAPHLKKMRAWTMFIAIVGLIMCAVQFVQGILLIAANKGAFGLGTVVMAMVQGTAYVLLLVFSLRAGRFLEDRTEQRLLAAMSTMHAFWMYIGILLCIALILLLLAISLMMAGVAMLSDPTEWMQ